MAASSVSVRDRIHCAASAEGLSGVALAKVSLNRHKAGTARRNWVGADVDRRQDFFSGEYVSFPTLKPPSGNCPLARATIFRGKQAASMLSPGSLLSCAFRICRGTD